MLCDLNDYVNDYVKACVKACVKATSIVQSMVMYIPLIKRWGRVVKVDPTKNDCNLMLHNFKT